MLEMVAHGGLDNFRRFRCRQLVFRLTLKLRFAHKYRYQSGGGAHHILAGNHRGFFIVDAFAIGFQTLGQRGAHALFMGAAFGRRHGVTIAGIHAVGIADTGGDPNDGPFARAVAARFLHLAGKYLRRHRGAPADLLFQIILQPVGKFQHILRRTFGFILDEGRVAFPADFNAAKQIGLGFCHGVKPRRVEVDFAENLCIGHESHGCTAFVFRLSDFLQLALRQAARKLLPVQGLLTRHIDHQFAGQRIDHRHTDAVQAAGSIVSLAAEFTARIQRRHYHFKGRFVFIFRMRIDRNAAPIITHGQAIALHHFDLDKAGMARNRLIHGVVDDLGKQMVHGAAVSAANIHARAAAHRL